MSLVNGSDYDHIDLHPVSGGDVTRHMFKDAQARQDASDLKSALEEYNTSNVLPRFAGSNGTLNGITYTVVDGYTWNLSGTATANLNRNLYTNAESLPDWFAPGKVLRIRLNKSGNVDAVRLVIYAYDGTNPTVDDRYMQTTVDTDYVVPDTLLSKPGLMVRLYIGSGSTVDGTIRPQIVVGMPNSDIVAALSNLQTDSLKYVAHPEQTYAGKTLAEIDDNIICMPARTDFPAPDTAASGPFINLRYVAGYNLQIQVANGSGNIYTRIITRSNHTVYRDWVQLASQSAVDDINTDLNGIEDTLSGITGILQILQTDSLKYIAHPEQTYAGKTLAEINDSIVCMPVRTDFPAPDTAASGPFINLHYVAGYNLQIQVANGSGNIYTRIIKRSDASVYRDWVATALKSDVDNQWAAIFSRFDNKKVYCDGDSIMYGVTTYDGGRATLTLPQNLAERIPNATVENKAHGGDRIQHTGDTSTSISDSIIADSTVGQYDYFMINGGTNDYTGDVPIGTIDGTETNTFYYGLTSMIDYIFSQNPFARIMLITPIFRNYAHAELGNAYYLQNRAGATLGDYCDAMIAVGKKYCIPVYDSRFNAPFNEDNYTSTLHLRAAGSQGYLHPTDQAYRVWGNSVSSFFLANF